MSTTKHSDKHLINVVAPQQLENVTETVDSPSKRWFYFPKQLQDALDALKESQITKSVEMIDVILEIAIDYLVPSNIVEDGAVFIGKCLPNTKKSNSDTQNNNDELKDDMKFNKNNKNNNNANNNNNNYSDDKNQITKFDGYYIWTDLGPQLSIGNGKFSKDGKIAYTERNVQSRSD